MSGHSKWNNIKRKKEKTDAQKGKIFTKIGREMAVAVREGGPDPMNNGKLRDLIAKAKANNVPNDNIDRIIKKAAGEGDKNTYVDMVYEGYGPSGVAVIVEALTDNKTAPPATCATTLTNAAVTWAKPAASPSCLTTKVSSSSTTRTAIHRDQIMEDCMEAGAEDFEFGDGVIEISAHQATPTSSARCARRWRPRATALWRRTSRRCPPPTPRSTTLSCAKDAETLGHAGRQRRRSGSLPQLGDAGRIIPGHKTARSKPMERAYFFRCCRHCHPAHPFVFP